MEDFLIFVLFVAVFYLLVRQSQLSGRLKELERLRMPTAPQASRWVPPAPTGSAPEAVAATARVEVEPAIAQPVVAAAAVAPVAEVPHQAPYTPAAAAAPVAARPVAPPPADVPPAAKPVKPHVSLEERLGQNWLSKLGIVSVVVGLALFLGRELVTFGPVGKTMVALAIALLLLVGGLWLERRENYTLFARACMGGGWALLYFLAFAIQHLEALRLLPDSTAGQLMDLLLMLAVASAMVAHSLRYRSQLVTTLAFLLAFLTIGISHVTVFSLVAGALLAVALAVIVARERWFALGLAGVVGVYLNHFLWLSRVLPPKGEPFALFVPSAALLLGYWLAFRLVYVLREPKATPTSPDLSLQQTCGALSAVLNAAGLLGLLKMQSEHPEWAFWALVALGAVEFGLAFVARPRNRAAFVVLSSLASVWLLAAVPFKFSGASWPLFWMLQAEALLLAGLRLQERVLRRLGLLAALTPVPVLLLFGAGVVTFELNGVWVAVASHTLAATLLTTAVLLWLNAELGPRLWAAWREDGLDAVLLSAGSYAAVGLAALGLTLLLPTTQAGMAWVAVVWLGLAAVLAVVSERLGSRELATQVDLLAMAAVLRLFVVNLTMREPRLFTDGHTFGSLRLWTVVSALVLLMGLARRSVRAQGMDGFEYVAPVYTWAAAAVVATFFWMALPVAWIAAAWLAWGLLLFEVGLQGRAEGREGRSELSFLRPQGYAFFGLCFVRLLVTALAFRDVARHSSTRVWTVLPLVAGFAWVYERTRRSELVTGFDRTAGVVAAWCGLLAAALLTYLELRAALVLDAWALLAVLLLTIAVFVPRRLFVAQSLVMLLAALLRAVFVNLPEETVSAHMGLTVRTMTVGVACAMLLLALSAAFTVRRHFAEAAVESRGLEVLLRRPEQPFFFVPLLLGVALLYVELAGGLITIGWSALGVAVFLFALAVRERSYRLSGLGLLLLGVAKILLWDIWHVNATDRYITLIVMGTALLLVSFLYSRYKETLLRLL